MNLCDVFDILIAEGNHVTDTVIEYLFSVIAIGTRCRIVGHAL